MPSSPPLSNMASVRLAYQSWVLPCGREAVNRLEGLLDRKFALAREFASAPDPGASGIASFLQTVLPTRGHREAIATPENVGRLSEVARTAATGRLSPRELPALAARIEGVPASVAFDLTAELVHAAAPDRFGLWSRWVWNPERKSGALTEFVQPGPETVEALQASLGEIRLELAALGFPSPTFAPVDILLALTHAQRLQRASDESFRGGGMESLLPGPYGLASMILGVRRWLTHADR